MKLTEDRKCGKCGSDQFFADEVLAWSGSTNADWIQNPNEKEIHFFKCYESSTENVMCQKCGEPVDDIDDYMVYYD